MSLRVVRGVSPAPRYIERPSCGGSVGGGTPLLNLPRAAIAAIAATAATAAHLSMARSSSMMRPSRTSAVERSIDSQRAPVQSLNLCAARTQLRLVRRLASVGAARVGRQIVGVAECATRVRSQHLWRVGLGSAKGGGSSHQLWTEPRRNARKAADGREGCVVLDECNVVQRREGGDGGGHEFIAGSVRDGRWLPPLAVICARAGGGVGPSGHVQEAIAARRAEKKFWVAARPRDCRALSSMEVLPGGETIACAAEQTAR